MAPIRPFGQHSAKAKLRAHLASRSKASGEVETSAIARTKGTYCSTRNCRVLNATQSGGLPALHWQYQKQLV